MTSTPCKSERRAARRSLIIDEFSAMKTLIIFDSLSGARGPFKNGNPERLPEPISRSLIMSSDFCSFYYRRLSYRGRARDGMSLRECQTLFCAAGVVKKRFLN